jgi:glycosyltransferase involved in cell wall biosynthesis
VPVVSVVIPTRNRPDLVLRSVGSALSQTLADIEVVVVIDGPDTSTEAALAAVKDSRLKIVSLPESVGGAEARNRGAQAGSGKWIALLDDDDEWMPTKLEKQVAKCESSKFRYPVIGTKLIGRTPKTDYIWPRVEPYSPIGDYLMRRRSLFVGDSVLQTSTLLTSRELFMICPFTKGLRKHQDWDWLIRALEVPGAGLEFVPEILAIWYIEEKRSGIGALNDWRYSLDWANTIRPLITADAYSSFLLTFLAASASTQRQWSAFMPLLSSSIRRGKPRPIQLGLFLGMWLIPIQFRQYLRRIFRGEQKTRPA